MKSEMSDNHFNTDDMGETYFLIGLLNRFNNGFQVIGDALFTELSWKQVFFLNCVVLCGEAPTIKEMAQVLGCSHQNAKQILTKLERAGFVKLCRDAEDRRKQRIILTGKAEAFRKKYAEPSERAMRQLFADIDMEELKTTIKVITQLDDRLKDLREEKE